MSSVAAPPRHPAPSISNTSCGARETNNVHCTVLVRKSVVSRYEVIRVLVVHVKFYLGCALSCHWCVRVNVCWRSDAVARDYKKGLETRLKRAIMFVLKINC